MKCLQINTKSHYSYIDFIRVFSICMVIILHCIYEHYNNLTNIEQKFRIMLGYVNELSRTGVPLFFMISGFLLLNGDIANIKAFYKKRILKIGIPFLIYDIFYYIFFCIFNKNSISITVFLKELINCGSAYHLWFIYSILFLYLIIPFIKIIIDKISFKTTLWLFSIIIFQTTIKPFINTIFNGYIYVYLTEDGILGYLGYMLLGYILGSHKFTLKIKGLIYITGIVFFAAIPIMNTHSAKTNGIFPFNGGYTINHYAEAAAIFLFYKNRIHNSNKCISAIAFITMDAYFIHVFILELLKKYSSWNIGPFTMIILWIILTILLSFSWGFMKNKLTVIFTGAYKYLKKTNNNNSIDNIFR